MKSLSTKIILSALGIALLASPALAAHRARTQSYPQQTQAQHQPGGVDGIAWGEDVDHGMW